MSKRKLVDLNDVNEPFWPASPNIDTEGLDEWRERIISSLSYQLDTTDESIKMYEKFILNGLAEDDREYREEMVGSAMRKQLMRKEDLLNSLLDMGPILL